MVRFADQIEFRVDRRHLLLFFLGAMVWTLVAFFFGLFVAGGGQQGAAHRGLAALGWLDEQARQQVDSSKGTLDISFQQDKQKPQRATRLATTHNKARTHAAAPAVARPAPRQLAQPAPAGPRPRLAAAHVPRHRPKPVRRKPPKAQKADDPPPPPKGKLTRKQYLFYLAPRSNARYTVSLRLPKSRASVLRLYNRLNKHGYRPILGRIALSRGRRRYRVTIGYFPTRQHAKLFLKRFQTRERLKGSVTRKR